MIKCFVNGIKKAAAAVCRFLSKPKVVSFVIATVGAAAWLWLASICLAAGGVVLGVIGWFIIFSTASGYFRFLVALAVS